MRPLYALLVGVLFVASPLPLLGKDKHHVITRTNTKKLDISNILGKPTSEATVEGLHMKVWLMMQKKQQMEMKKQMTHHNTLVMNDISKETWKESQGVVRDDMPVDKTTNAMMTGTHHIMLDVTDAVSGKDISDISAKVLVVFPSRTNSTFDMKPMMSDFGAALPLREKGEYQFTIVVRVHGVPISKQFQYRVK